MTVKFQYELRKAEGRKWNAAGVGHFTSPLGLSQRSKRLFTRKEKIKITTLHRPWNVRKNQYRERERARGEFDNMHKFLRNQLLIREFAGMVGSY